MVSKEINKEINMIKKNLSLISEDFKILPSNDCSIYWDRNIRKYVVEINRNQIDYFLIHEFGHVFSIKNYKISIFCEIYNRNRKN